VTSAPLVSRILVVDDDANLTDVVSRYLRKDGFEVDTAADGISGLQRALETLPDLVVLDAMLPELDGFAVCQRIREVAPIPVVMLTARGEEDDRLLGFERGADDYVTKPFSPRELTARVRAVLRRARGEVGVPANGVLRIGNIEIDQRTREVTRDGEQVSLAAREFDLLAFFARNPRRVFSREDLLSAVWGWTYGDTATVTVHIRRLRLKLEDDVAEPEHFLAVRGVGYRCEP
jgi:DNA-binding response OmpR family regulator